MCISSGTELLGYWHRNYWVIETKFKLNKLVDKLTDLCASLLAPQLLGYLHKIQVNRSIYVHFLLHCNYQANYTELQVY